MVDFGGTHDPISLTFRPNGATRDPGILYLTHRKTSMPDLGRAVEVLATGRVQSWRYNINSSPGPWERFL